MGNATFATFDCCVISWVNLVGHGKRCMLDYMDLSFYPADLFLGSKVKLGWEGKLAGKQTGKQGEKQVWSKYQRKQNVVLRKLKRKIMQPSNKELAKRQLREWIGIMLER